MGLSGHIQRAQTCPYTMSEACFDNGENAEAGANDGTVLILRHPSNSELARVWASKATDVTIWGGESLNCGEDGVSRLVRDQQQRLARFIFLPCRHKGGRMVRPHYYCSDRRSPMTFPSLRTIGYYEDCGTPTDAKWVAPNLETLFVFNGNGYRNDGEEKMLRSWNVSATGGGPALPDRVLEESPNLKEIICAKPDFSETFRFQTLRRLLPPRPLPPECLRLISVVLKKEDASTCRMAALPAAVMMQILAFCHSSAWKITDYTEIGKSC